MIRVMIVDDEPFIRQGIQILINWEQYGFEICGEAANGQEAVELMKTNEFDLIITDIKMPLMNGLELIEYTYEHITKKIRFIILSGYYEFEYAKKAIKYDVADYVLKPVQKDELIRVLEEYKTQYISHVENQKKLELSEKIVFDNYLNELISGKFEEKSLDYVKEHLMDDQNVRYISIEYDPMDEELNQLSNEEKIRAHRYLYDTLRGYLKNNWYHAFMQINSKEQDYSIGFVFVKKIAEESDVTEKEYITKLYENMNSSLNYRIILYIGQRLDSIEQISESYRSAAIAKSFQRFSNEKDISYYDEIEGRISTNKHLIDKEQMDNLIRAIEENNTDEINVKIEAIYDNFKEMFADPDIIKINLNYLLFNLINLAKELDQDFDQEEVYKMISQGGYEQVAVRGSIKHFKEFAHEFSGYLSQLRQHTFGGVLNEIDKEITEHYMENLSLKNLSEKYYINSAYLGQIFKKQYGSSFKDYLNTYRIDRAAELLIRSDEKIYLVANSVGFNNTDYFISKFVQQKGITPLQYRKQFLTRGNHKSI